MRAAVGGRMRDERAAGPQAAEFVGGLGVLGHVHAGDFVVEAHPEADGPVDGQADDGGSTGR